MGARAKRAFPAFSLGGRSFSSDINDQPNQIYHPDPQGALLRSLRRKDPLFISLRLAARSVTQHLGRRSIRMSQVYFTAMVSVWHNIVKRIPLYES